MEKSISPYSDRMRENKDQEKLRIWTLFTDSHYKSLQNVLLEIRENGANNASKILNHIKDMNFICNYVDM